MHDLRRTVGSYMAMNNLSLQTIGQALGHKSPAITQIYSRFAREPLRDAMEKAQTEILSQAGVLPEKNNIVNMPDQRSQS